MSLENTYSKKNIYVGIDISNVSEIYSGNAKVQSFSML